MFSLGDVFVRGKRVKIQLIGKGNGPFFTFFWCQRQRLWCYHYHILPHINDNMAQALFTTELCSVLSWASAAIKGFASRCHTKPNYALHELFILTAPSLPATRCFMLCTLTATPNFLVLYANVITCQF